jgi:hypothetical protein
VGSAGLDDRPEGLFAGDEPGVEPLEGGEQLLLDCHCGGQLERGRDDVIRGLAAVDLVVGVDLPTAEALRGQMRDDLVHVRVRRRARAGLVDVDRELVVVRPVGHLAGGGGDRLGHFGVEQPQLAVRVGGG